MELTQSCLCLPIEFHSTDHKVVVQRLEACMDNLLHQYTGHLDMLVSDTTAHKSQLSWWDSLHIDK